MTKKLTLPDNVTVFGHRKAETHTLPEFDVALHGQSFKDKAVVDNLAIGYPDPVPGYYNIGVLHTALEGYAAHANYAPCTLAELHAKGYDYYAGSGRIDANAALAAADRIVAARPPKA